jgi:hypothetical protein
MRFPLARFGQDHRPIQRWEWLFAPLVCPLFLLALAILGLVSVPYYWLYPETHTHCADLDGTDQEKQELARFREHRRHVSLWRRLLERLRIVEPDLPPGFPKDPK